VYGVRTAVAMGAPSVSFSIASVLPGRGIGGMSSVSIRLMRNASWNLVDQVLSALTNIVLSIVVARSVTAAGFGAFASAFVVFGISIAVTKSVVGQPLQMRFSDATPDQRREANAAALGCALALGLAAGLVVVMAALVVSGSVGRALLALAIVLPGLLVQDSCRMAAFALGRPSLAAMIDAVWAVVQFGLIAALHVAGHKSVFALVLAWGAAATVSAVVGLVALNARPQLRAAAGWFRSHRDLIRFLLPEYFLSLGAMQFGILLVGGVASASAVGSLRAAQVLLGPLGVLGSAVFQFSVPEVARRHDRSARDRWRFAVAIGGGLGLVTVCYVVLLLVMPAAFGRALFGESWAGAATVLLAVGCSSAASALANGPAGVLYGMGQARATFRINLTKGPVLVAALLAGTLWAGAVGAGWAFALVEAVVLPAWVLTLRHSLRSDSGSRPTAARLGSGPEELDMVGRG
jgi:O-antigen/teichoic acid export membrane protein